MNEKQGHMQTDMSKTLIALFQKIETERMDGIPVLNKNLNVDCVGFEQHGDFYLGVLLTPWFMNLMLVPVDRETSILDDRNVGAKLVHNLPAGRFEFIVGHEEELGRFMSCSLFSPVFEFSDQEAAMETAHAAFEEVLTDLNPDDEEDDGDDDMREIWAGRLPVENLEQTEETPNQGEPQQPKELSRRDVIRGLRNSDLEETAEQQS